MATVTPNFNWPVPTSTDLVKDGATAIEALGDSIDASLVDLKGGTTGQVLSKTSGTDMDFTWVTSDDANAIQNTIVDAKGDLIAATAADTPARLAVGTNGQVLTADSTAATGLAWATSTSGGMTLLSTTTLSGASTTVSSISGAYQDLYVIVTGMTNATANGSTRVAINGSTTASVSVGNFYASAAGGFAVLYNDYTTRYAGNNTGLLRTDANNSYVLKIYNYASSTTYKNFDHTLIGLDGNSTNYAQSFQGGYYSNSAVTSIVFSNSGGNWSTGTVKIYGVK
jgi:hypothetical protein